MTEDTPVSVTMEKDGEIAVIIVNNPPVNALSWHVRQGLEDNFKAALADVSVKAIVLRCAGATFIAGADISEFGKPPRGPDFNAVLNMIEAAPKPVVAAIHGTALGGGLETALVCHYRVAVPSAKLGVPEVKLGLLPGAADFLVIGLHTGGQVQMRHKTNVRFVYAHAKGDGRDHDQARLGHERVLVGVAVHLVHAGVIGQRPQPLFVEECGHRFGLLPRQAVDDAAGVRMTPDEAQHLALGIALRLDRKLQVRPVEAEHELLHVAAEQPGRDVVARHRVGRRSQCDHRHAREAVNQLAQRLVLLAE